MCGLYRGIFWIKALAPIDAIVVKSECNATGHFLTNPNTEASSQSGENYNHKKAWDTLDKSTTSNYPYNYYPRGRVEIRNGKALIFANINIINAEFKIWVENEFNLTGLKQIRIIADMSNHYLCHFDKEDF